MNKKTYIEPAIVVKAMAEEAAVMAAVSIDVDPNKEGNPSEAESKGSVWDWMED